MSTQRQILPTLAMTVSLTNMVRSHYSHLIAAMKDWLFLSFSQGRTMLHCVLLPVRGCVCVWGRGKMSLHGMEEEQQLRPEKQLYLFKACSAPLPPCPLSLNEPLTPLFWPSSPTEPHDQGLHSHTDTQYAPEWFHYCSAFRGHVQAGCMCY